MIYELGQDTAARIELEEKKASGRITLRESFLLMGAYRYSSQYLKEAQMASFIIEAFSYENYELHVRLINATKNYVIQSNSPKSLISDVIKAIRPKHEDYRDFFIFTSRVLFKVGLQEEAQDYAVRAFELSTTRSEKIRAQLLRIRIARAIGNPQTNYELWLEMNNMAPDYVPGVYWLAYSQFRGINDPEEALGTIEEIYSLNPNSYYHQRAYDLNIRVLLRLGYYDRAEILANTAKIMFPENQILQDLDASLNSYRDSVDDDKDEY